VALKRLLALLVAVGLVVGALALRERIEGRDVAAGDPGTSDSGDGTGPVLVCDTELGQVCDRLGEALRADGVRATVVMRTAPAMVDELVTPAADTRAGAWLTLGPWTEMGAQRGGGGRPVLVGDPQVLARSPLVVVMPEDRAGVLEDHCGGFAWRCLGEAAAGTWARIGGQDAWGPVKPGHRDPQTSTSGALVLGQLAHAWFGQPAVSARDIDDDLGFFSWFTGLERAVPTFTPSTGTPLAELVTVGHSRFDLVAVPEAEAMAAFARAPDRAATLTVRLAEPVVTADVVVAALGQDAGLAAAVAVRAPGLLAEAGWRVDGEAPSDVLQSRGVALPAELPEGTGLPSAGALEALRRTWLEVTR
jgi:hypothetical protein